MIASFINRIAYLPVFLFAAVFAVAVHADLPPATAPTTKADNDAQKIALQAKLDQHLGQCRYNAERLDNVIDDLRKQSGANIVVDWPSLAKAGINRDAPVTARLRDIKLSRALELVSKSVEGEDDDHKLGYTTVKDHILITTLKELLSLNTTESYEIADLGDERRDEIMRLITDSVDTASWRDNGGDFGTIDFDRSKHLIVISQTPENQRKVAALLAKLREAGKASQEVTTQP
jgi:hypothetical protein